MTVKEHIEKNLKTAMLAGDKPLVTTLRGLKSALLYAEVAANTRDSGISDSEAIGVLQKEAKKRQESIAMYRQGGNEAKASDEEAELVVIQEFLPAQMSEAEIGNLVKTEAERLSISDVKQMGQLIGAVKQATSGAADGAIIARLVKEYFA